MPAACSVMFRWQSCQSSSSTLLTSSMLSFVRCRFTLGFHRANVKPLSVNTRPFMNDSGDRFALARSRLSSRHGAAPREMITAHRLSFRHLSAPRALKVRLWCRRPCWMRCCAGDEGCRPFGVALRGVMSNRLKLRWLKTVVVSVGEKAQENASGGDREGERERTADDVSKQAADIRTGSVKWVRDEPGGSPFTGQAVSGMEAARVRSAASAWNVGRQMPTLPPLTPEGAGGGREGARRTAETGGAEYRRGICWRTGS